VQDLSPDGPDIESVLAAEAATEVFLDHELARLKDRLRRRSLELPQWRDASGLAGETTWLTAAELRTVWDRFQKLMFRFMDRGQNPAEHPRGARGVRLFVSATVAPPAASTAPQTSRTPQAPEAKGGE
jgi:hypothetical protein